jgi:hypothetical protein
MNQLQTEPNHLRTGGNRFVQAAAILPVVTGKVVPALPIPAAQRRVWIRQDCLKMNSARMKTSELKMLWNLVKSAQDKPMSAADFALLLRIRFALQEYEVQSTERRARFNLCKKEVG